MDIRPGPKVPRTAKHPPALPPRPDAGAGESPPILRNQKRLVPLVCGLAAAVALLFMVIWYAIGLPGASESVRRTLGRLPEARSRILPSPTPHGPVSLLTGVPCGEAYKRRPVAVMLGSDPISRPLAGFADADLVVEMPVLTNNVTRLMAVYQCGHPTEIGGVRSARHDYLFLAKGFDAVLAHWGGSYHALNRIRFERVKSAPVYETIDALRNPFNAFYRTARLPAPYNGYTTYDRLWGALKALQYRTYSVFQGYPHVPDAPEEARGAGTLDLGWPGSLRVRYVYHPSTNTYERSWGGVRHTDGIDSRPISPKVLVVIHVKQRLAKGAGGYNDVDIEGTGPAAVYQNGQVIQGTWAKSDIHKQDPLVFVTALGAPIAFVPGQIWMHVVDSQTPVLWTPGVVAPPEVQGEETPKNFGG